MSRSSLRDHAVQVHVDEVQARRRAPVAEQPRLDVLARERLAQQRVVEQVDLADRQVVGGAPERVEIAELRSRERVPRAPPGPTAWAWRPPPGALRSAGHSWHRKDLMQSTCLAPGRRLLPRGVSSGFTSAAPSRRTCGDPPQIARRNGSMRTPSSSIEIACATRFVRRRRSQAGLEPGLLLDLRSDHQRPRQRDTIAGRGGNPACRLDTSSMRSA